MSRHPALIHVVTVDAAGAGTKLEQLAAAEEAIRVVAPLAAVERVRVPPQPGGEELRIRGPLVAWNAPADAGRRQYGAMAAFAAAFEATPAAAGGSGDRA